MPKCDIYFLEMSVRSLERKMIEKKKKVCKNACMIRA